MGRRSGSGRHPSSVGGLFSTEGSLRGGNAPNPIFLTDGALGCRDLEASDAEEEAENKERLHDSLDHGGSSDLEFCFGFGLGLWSSVSAWLRRRIYGRCGAKYALQCQTCT